MSKGTVTRRDFIKLGTRAAATGLAAKVTILNPARLAAAARPVPLSDIVRFAAIGTGIEGCKLLICSLAIPGVECVATADLCDGRHLASREALGGKEIETTRDYRRLIERKDIDAIVCATSDHWHRRIVEEACQAGKDVYCERPLSHSVEGSVAVVVRILTKRSRSGTPPRRGSRTHERGGTRETRARHQIQHLLQGESWI